MLKKLPSKLDKPREKLDPRTILLNSKLAAELRAEGVELFKPVEDGGNLNINGEYLTLPLNITEMPAYVISEYLNAFTQQKLYMRSLYWEMECLVEESRRIYEKECNDKYKTLSGQKLSETAKERLLNNDPDIVPSHNQLSEARLKWSLIGQTIESISEAIFLISREITRRGNDFKDENRNVNVGRG